MTKVLVVGGGGMIGQKIASQLSALGLDGKPVETVTLLDFTFPENGSPANERIIGGFGNQAILDRVLSDRPDIIIHLAAVVSAAAEHDFEAGWDTNAHKMWVMLEAIRQAHMQDGYCPRFVFASSVAVFGGGLPDVIPDDFRATPQSSYGAQKVVGEMFVSDFSRKGFIDGISLRLPTISVRPGKPNLAASSCFSGIIREPLNGKEAILPIDAGTVHIHASPRSAATFFRHAATLDTSRLDKVRVLNMPCVSCSIEEQIDALRKVAGSAAVSRIKHVPDPAIESVVKTWPRAFAFDRARALGFHAETDFLTIVETYLEDDFDPDAVVLAQT